MKAAGLIIALGILVTGADMACSRTQMTPSIERNDYGKGKKVEELDVQIGNKKKKVRTSVEVSERQYSAKEVQELFSRIIRKMDRLILAGNETLDRVDEDLDLVTDIPGEPVKVSWELDRYDVMDIQGKLKEQNISEKGVLVKLNAVLTYTANEEEQASYQCVACVYPKKLSGEESTKKDVEEAIKKADTATKEKKKLILPEMLDTNELRYYQPFNERGPVITVMGMMIGILLYALQKQNIRKAEEERKKQMIEDYPEVISKLTLYLGAGMTVKKARRKITEGYMKEKEDENERYVYEEMRQTCHEMDSGVTEAEGYENFGRRCDLQIYIRLGALLSQNLRKGTKGLSELLKLESIQAFEERKARAKRLGEEAGTAFANVSDAGSGIDHCYSPGFFDHADIKDKKGRDVMWRIRYALQVLKDDRGIGVVEVILILVVLIGLVIIFKSQLTSLVQTIFEKITSESSGI